MSKLFLSFFILLSFEVTCQNIIEQESARYYRNTFAKGLAQTNPKELIRVDSFLSYSITYQKPAFDSIYVSYRHERFSRLYFYFRTKSVFDDYLAFCNEHYKRKDNKSTTRKFTFYSKKERKYIRLFILTPESVTEKRYMILIYDDKNFGRI